MKRWLIFLPIIVIFLIASCGPSSEEITAQTATAATAMAAAWTKTPTPTLILTPTFTPTLTSTPTTVPTMTATPLGGGSGQIACLYCMSIPRGVISLVKPDGTGAIPLSDKNSMGASFAWSKNGARLAYFTITGSSGSTAQKKYLTCVVDADSQIEKCFEVGGGTFSLSPDGNKLAIGEFSPTLSIIDFDSGKSEVLMEAPPQWSGWDVDWSPDGTKLVVAGGEIGITVINIMNKQKYPVVEADKPDYYNTPRWSPDGKQIVYVKHNNLFIVNADGSDDLLLVRNAYDPLWSPDGTHITYITGNSNQQNIIMMNVDGTNKVKLTPTSQSFFGNGTIRWSADGKYILYLAYIGSPYDPQNDLYAIDVHSQKIIGFTKSHNVVSYTLSPDGSVVAYTTSSPVVAGKQYSFKSFVVSLDGTMLYEWNSGTVGPWRP